MKIKSPKNIRNLSVFIVAWIFLPTGILATTLVRLSLEQLAEASDVVARVHCGAAESRWENGAIWTVTTFDVIETMKGGVASQVIVRVPGGRVGHLTASIDGTPKFNPGDDAVLFLQRSPAGGFSVAGWVEGTFRISIDARTFRQTVTQDSSAFSVFDTATRTFQTGGIRRMPIDQFRARVSAAITRARGGSR